MESFTTYKVPQPAKPDLFVPPPYCRKPEKSKEGENVEEIPSLKLIVSNPAKILLLCEKLTDGCSSALEAKINTYLMKETGSKLAFIIHLIPAFEEAVVQTVGGDELETPVRMPVSEKTIKSLVKYEKEVLFCGENLDPQLKAIFNEIFLETKHQIISVPILSRKQKCYPCTTQDIETVLLVCFVDSQKDENFVIKLANELFRFCLTLLLNTVAVEEEARQKRQCQSLLGVARRLFSHLEDVNDLLREIMCEARQLTNAQKCSLFLLDPEHMHLVAKVFDGTTSAKISHEVKIAKDQGIAGHVASTGKLLNIKNAYEHPLFYKGVDESTGFKTRNILCFPIRDEKGIVGVAQLCNKKGGNFNHFDEEVANAFSIYCGLSIMHSLVYKQIQEAQARNKLSTELMMYHMKVSDEDIIRVLHCRLIHFYADFDLFKFSPRSIPCRETVCFVIKMFEDLGFITQFSMKKEVLTRFVMFVERGYRDTPYHNWMHAFSVAHFAYLCIKNFELVEKKYITNLEALALFISCLCHDIDHRGTNNAFQQQSNTVLASLYSSQGSVMERHHLSHTICTINTEGCNFLECLNREDYTLCLDLIKDMILATDLATHFKIYRKQYNMVQDGYNNNNPEHRYALVCLLMTCADLSDQTKGWSVIKKVTEGIYEEFFAQGDLEKKMGKEPIEMMDREKASIPDLQVEFLTGVCLPAFKMLAAIFPQAKELAYRIKRNILHWESSRCMFKIAMEEGRSCLDVLKSTELETEIEKIVHSLETQ